jgi:hypothetical protein
MRLDTKARIVTGALVFFIVGVAGTIGFLIYLGAQLP